MQCAQGVAYERGGGLSAAGRFPCPTVGRKGREGEGAGATSVHFSISLSPFGFDRSLSLPSSLPRLSVRLVLALDTP